MSFKTVLFDLGGTLINYENHSWDELGRMGCRNAHKLLEGVANDSITPERLWEDFHNAIDQMFNDHRDDLKEIDLYEVTANILANLGITSSDGLSKRFLEAYYRPISAQINLIPGAAEMLARLKIQGLKIGLISNTIFPAEYHRAEMREFGILRFFDFTLFSSEFGVRKPHRDIFLKALELAGTKPQDAVFVGDRLVEDVGGPQEIGIRGILKHMEDRDYTAPVEPYKTIHMLEELDKIIMD